MYGRVVCRMCVSNLTRMFLKEDKGWANKNPFVIATLIGLLSDKIYCPFNVDNKTEPMITLPIHSVPLPDGQYRLREHRIRFPLTGDYSYSNITEHYPEIKDYFEGKSL